MKTHHLKLFFSLILPSALIILLTGCSASIYELRSVEENPDYYRGRQVIYKEDNECLSSVSFESQQKKNFIFYVTVKNLSDNPFTVLPEKMYAEQMDDNKKLLGKFSDNRYFALDPEEKIHRLNLQRGYNESSHSFTTGITAAFALMSIVSEAIDHENKDKTGSINDDLVNWSDAQDNENNRYANEMNYLDTEIEFWRDYALRKTTLYKNESTDGYVTIPFNPYSKFIRFIIPLDSTEHIYEFKMIEVK